MQSHTVTSILISVLLVQCLPASFLCLHAWAITPEALLSCNLCVNACPSEKACCCSGMSAAGGAGQHLYMTPDILASVYQCNITFLDDPSIRIMNPNLR